ncbi:MAG: hypothetical protein AAGF87_12040 [Bacteroidota bacterium]
MSNKFISNFPSCVRTIDSAWMLSKEIDLRHVTLIDLDLKLTSIDWENFTIDATTLFLGCEMDKELEIKLRSLGASMLAKPQHLPYQPLRSRLYTWQELMHGYSPEDDQSYDLRIYTHFSHYRSSPCMQEALYERLHDFSMDEALRRLLSFGVDGLPKRRCVGFMGGHSMGRDKHYYRLSVQTAKLLTEAGFLVVSGGGPGIMEAANLGAYLAGRTQDELDWVLDTLARAPKYTDPGFHEAALKVLDRFPDGEESLAIPTWFYGHEPSNLFATYIAKYFSNSIREDTLLAISIYGIVFAPGSAGTTQEIFQDAAQNHYVTFDYVSPMVFLSKQRYEIDTSIFPLLQQLAKGKDYAAYLHLTDDPADVVNFIQAKKPKAVKDH